MTDSDSILPPESTAAPLLPPPSEHVTPIVGHTLSVLHSDLLVHVCSFLPYPALFRLGFACQGLRQASSHVVLWRTAVTSQNALYRRVVDLQTYAQEHPEGMNAQYQRYGTDADAAWARLVLCFEKLGIPLDDRDLNLNLEDALEQQVDAMRQGENDLGDYLRTLWARRRYSLRLLANFVGDHTREASAYLTRQLQRNPDLDPILNRNRPVVPSEIEHLSAVILCHWGSLFCTCLTFALLIVYAVLFDSSSATTVQIVAIVGIVIASISLLLCCGTSVIVFIVENCIVDRHHVRHLMGMRELLAHVPESVLATDYRFWIESPSSLDPGLREDGRPFLRVTKLDAEEIDRDKFRHMPSYLVRNMLYYSRLQSHGVFVGLAPVFVTLLVALSILPLIGLVCFAAKLFGDDSFVVVVPWAIAAVLALFMTLIWIYTCINAPIADALARMNHRRSCPLAWLCPVLVWGISLTALMFGFLGRRGSLSWTVAGVLFAVILTLAGAGCVLNVVICIITTVRSCMVMGGRPGLAATSCDCCRCCEELDSSQGVMIGLLLCAVQMLGLGSIAAIAIFFGGPVWVGVIMAPPILCVLCMAVSVMSVFVLRECFGTE